MRRFKFRLIPFVLAAALGAGLDAYARAPDGPGPQCCFYVTWKCFVVMVADDPVVLLRVTWRMLTED